MKLKNQVTHAIENPQPSGRVVVLRWKSELLNLIHFNSYNAALDKHISGRLQIKGEDLVARIDDHSSYSKKYARKKLRADLLKLEIHPATVRFDAPLSLALPEPKVGDIIATKVRIGTIQVGDPDVVLPKETQFYAVKNDLIDCNGDSTIRAFTARFTETIERPCDDNPVALSYNRFLLIS